VRPFLPINNHKLEIRHNEGFDFLGWTFRKFKGKLIIKPSKDSIKTLIGKCSSIILKDGKASSQSDLIRRLNQVIRGWANYHKHVVASQVFSYVNNTLYHLLQKWAKHRHPNKSKWWRLNKYWHEKDGKRWLFMSGEQHLIDMRTIKIVRHPKLSRNRVIILLSMGMFCFNQS
jgi:RNA-directed DNA polymerase